MQLTDLVDFVDSVDAPQAGPMMITLQHTLADFVQIGLGYRASTASPPRRPGVRRSA